MSDEARPAIHLPKIPSNIDRELANYLIELHRALSLATIVSFNVAGDFEVAGDTIRTPNIKSGATQAAAGANAGDLWTDTDDNTIKLGV